MTNQFDQGQDFEALKDGRGIDFEAGRRAFIRSLTVGAAGAAVFSAALSPTGAQAQKADAPSATTAITDADIFNFALNLEYLEAEFYLTATTGSGLPDSFVTGVGRLGAVSRGHIVPFQDPVIRNFAQEIARDEMEHVRFFRAVLGSAAIARPEIDINISFTVAARAAGIIGPTETFDAYANDYNFLLAAFIFEDVGVTAFKGAAPLITDRGNLESAAGILAVEAYHAGTIRSTLYDRAVKGLLPTAFFATQSISNLRDQLDGPVDDDQGIGDASTANIVPTDETGRVYSRTPQQVLNIVYGNPNTTPGLFFPAGVNGRITGASPAPAPAPTPTPTPTK